MRFQFRYLDTFTGRWASADPAFNIVTASTIERIVEANGAYGYVTNNPLDAIDPLGLKKQPKAKKKNASQKIDKKVGKKIRSAGRGLADIALGTRKNVDPMISATGKTKQERERNVYVEQREALNKKAGGLLAVGLTVFAAAGGVAGVLVGLDIADNAAFEEPNTEQGDGDDSLDDITVPTPDNGTGKSGLTPEQEQFIVTNNDSSGTTLTEFTDDTRDNTDSSTTGGSSNPELNIRF